MLSAAVYDNNANILPLVLKIVTTNISGDPSHDARGGEGERPCRTYKKDCINAWHVSYHHYTLQQFQQNYGSFMMKIKETPPN